MIEGLSLKNVRIDFFDRATELNESMKSFRGDSLLSFKGVERARLDAVEIFGGLSGVDKVFDSENCKNIIKENTNF